MATLGPASAEERVVRDLIRAGADVFRFNLSHGTHDEHAAALFRVRSVAEQEGIHIPVAFDLMGPRYRLGELPGGGRELFADEMVVMSPADGVDLPVDPGIVEHLKPGERVLLDGGLIELQIEEKNGEKVHARVIDGGPIKTRKGINLPDTDLPFEISGKDRADIAFAVALGADYLAASYVGAAEHVEAVRAAAESAGRRIPIIAKLERASAMAALDELTAASDALMVARGDLGVEVPLYTVPVLQKRIVAAGRKAGKPVIVATQMLESMVEQPRPTRAEATDVANAVLDGADALMLSGETAAGSYPVLAVSTMAGIILEAETYAAGLRGKSVAGQPLGEVHARRTFELDPTATSWDEPALEVPDVVCAAAVQAAGELRVSAVVAFSQSGFTARLAARYRPEAPILAFTPEERVARQLQLVWGVRPLVVAVEVGSLDDVVRVVERQLLDAGLVKPGERIIILMGHPIRDRPLTNLMRVHRVSGT